MIPRLIDRQNRPGSSVVRIRFAKNLAGSPARLLASLSAKWLRRSSTRSIRVARAAAGSAYAQWSRLRGAMGGRAWRAVVVGRYSLTPRSLLQIMLGPAVADAKRYFP